MASRPKTPTTPTPRVVSMTPEWAARLLAQNTDNRTIRARRVSYLVDQITHDRWHVTNDAITVATTGRLLNGQHRLSAIVRSGKTLPVLLLEGADEASFIVMDRGAGRTLADVTRRPEGMMADVSLLHVFLHGMHASLSPQQADDIADVWLPVWNALHEAVRLSPRHGANNALLRVGVGLRWATARTAAQREYVIANYRAFTQADLDSASRAVRVFYRRYFASQTKHGSRSQRVVAVINAYVHFDPKRADVEPLTRNPDEHAEELRQWVRMMSDAFAAGPARDGHPYLWPGEPKVERTVTGAAARIKNDPVFRAETQRRSNETRKASRAAAAAPAADPLS